MIMIARRVVPQIGFATTMTPTGRDFGSGRENPFGLETGHPALSPRFFFDMVVWSVHALVLYI